MMTTNNAKVNCLFLKYVLAANDVALIFRKYRTVYTEWLDILYNHNQHNMLYGLISLLFGLQIDPSIFSSDFASLHNLYI